MSAEIIQFVPRPNPERASLLEAKELEAAQFLISAPNLVVNAIWPARETEKEPA